MKFKRLLCSVSFALLSVGVISFGASAYANSKDARVEEAEATGPGGNGQIVTYDYTTANNYHAQGTKSASSLMTTLNNLVKSGEAGSYAGLWEAYKTCYVKSNGKMFDYYSSISSFTPGDDQAGSYKKEGDVYNREHSIPKSWWGGSESNQGADAFIVVPTDGWVNNFRSAYPMGMVQTISNRSSGDFSILGNAVSSWGYSGTVFEPDDSVKGDFARIVFYAVTRYRGDPTSVKDWGKAEGDSTFSGSLSTNFGLTSYAVKLYSYWNNLDKPDEWEMSVNDKVSKYQGNRNPFIDHPEYANTLWGTVSGYTTYEAGSSDGVTISTSSTSVAVGETVTVTATASDSSAITWTSQDETIATVVGGVITGVAAGVTTISASATISGIVYSKTCTVTVTSSGGGGGGGGGDTYEKATSISAGDTVLLVCETTKGELSGITTVGTYVSYETTPAGSYPLDVVAGSGTNTYSFKNGTNYLAWSSGNSLSTSTTKNSNSSWTVSFSSGNAIINNSQTSARQIWWNKSSPRFAAYAVSEAGNSYYNVQLYKKTSSGSKALSSISISGMTTSYNYGASFSFNGTCTAHYGDGSTATVTPTSVSTPTMTQIGEQEITVSYTEGGVTRTATYDINISKGSLSSITLDTSEVTKSFVVNGAFNYDGLVVTANYSTGFNEEVEPTNVSSTDMSTTGTKTVTVSYTYSGVTRTATYQIGVVADSITSIALAGIYQTVFNVGDTFNYTGLTVTATYLSGNVVSGLTPSSVFSPNMSTTGQKTVTVTYGGQSTTYTISVVDPSATNPTIDVPSGGSYRYEKVDTISDGTYLIVYETGNLIFNGGLATLDAASNTTSVTISNHTIASNATTDAASFNIASKSSGYTIKSSSGYFIGQSSDSNGMQTSITTEYLNAITFDSDDNAVIHSAGGAYLRYNSQSGQERFRYFKSSTYTSQQTIQLYKKVGSGGGTKTVEVTSITATGKVDMYHPGQTPVLSDFTVVANYNDSGAKTYTLTGSDYAVYLSIQASMITYGDAPSGGTTATKQVTISFTKPNSKVLSTNNNINVSREASVNPYTERLNYSNLFSQMTATKYSEVVPAGETISAYGVNYLVDNGYKYAGGQQLSLSYTGSGSSKTCIGSLKNTIATVLPISSVTVNGTITFDVTYSIDGNTFVSSMDPTKEYHYFKVNRTTTFSESYASINYIDIVYDGPAVSVSNLTNYIMFEDTTNQCDTKLDVAIKVFNHLDSEDKEVFLVSSTDYCVVTARERFNAWLKAKGMSISGSNGDYVISNRNSNILGMVNKEEIITLSTIIIISGIVFSSLVSYFVIKKRKEDK